MNSIRHFKFDKALAFFLLFLTGCTAATRWSYDTIATDDPQFHSSRLTYIPPNGYPPWKIEILKMNDEIEIFLSLVQYQLSPLAEDPRKIKIALFIEELSDLNKVCLEETVPLFEGNMRVRFSNSLAAKFIQSLQEGKKVSILIDGLEETLEPDLFKENFLKLHEKPSNWLSIQNPLK